MFKKSPVISIEDMLSLSDNKWVPIPRVSTKVPFGYKVDPADDKVLLPITFELECLDKAKEYLTQGHSLRKAATWLTEVSGRYISHEGLSRRVEIDKRRVGKAAVVKRWAFSIQKAVEELKAHDEKLGNDTSWFENWWREGKLPTKG